MWSLGKILKTAEVPRIFTGSYWDEPLLHNDFVATFEKDEALLLSELVSLSAPASTVQRKVNEIIKRIRIIKVHLCIFSYLRKQSRTFLGIGNENVRDRLINNMAEVFDLIREQYDLSQGDMPDVELFTRRLKEHCIDFAGIPAVRKSTLNMLDDLLVKDIPEMMKELSGSPPPKHVEIDNRPVWLSGLGKSTPRVDFD